jgi:NDP-sugar pyrophosphorylase family protein
MSRGLDETPVVLLAAGAGTRLRPLTGTVPKPLAPVVNRPVLGHLLDLVRHHGGVEVFANLHYLGHLIEQAYPAGLSGGLSTTYRHETELLGTAGGVANFREAIGERTFLVLSGDAFTDVDLSAFLAAHRARGGIATVALTRARDVSQFGVVVTDRNGKIEGFQEKPAPEDALSDLVNCGIYAFEPEIFDFIPPDTFVDFGHDVFPVLLAARTPFYGWTMDGYWNDIGSIQEYVRSNFDALLGLVRVEVPGREMRPFVRVGADVKIGPDVELAGPVLIGDGCRIGARAKLRGPLILGSMCEVGAGAVFSGSVVWSGVNAGSDVDLANCIVGDHVTIAPGVVAEPGSVIASHAVIAEAS